MEIFTMRKFKVAYPIKKKTAIKDFFLQCEKKLHMLLCCASTESASTKAKTKA